MVFLAKIAGNETTIEKVIEMLDGDCQQFGRFQGACEFIVNNTVNLLPWAEKELASLAPFEADGLVKRNASGLAVTDAGRLFIRNIAMCFDNTLAPAGERRHSKTI